MASLIHSFLPEQEVAEIHKGVNAVNTFVLFFSHLCLVLVKRVDFANFRRFQFCATFGRLFKVKSRGNDQNFPFHPAGCSLNPNPESLGRLNMYDIGYGYPKNRSQKDDHFSVCSLDPSRF